MENNKLTQDLLKQLKRIADALEKTNLIEERKEKRAVKIEKLDEKIKTFNLKLIKERANRIIKEAKE